MEIGDIIGIATAVVGVVGALVTAIISYMSNRSNTKSDLARIKLEENRSLTDNQLTNVSAANQLLGIGLQQTTFLQNLYSECMQSKKLMDDENTSLKFKLINLRLAILTIKSELLDIVDDFRDHLKDEHNADCVDVENQLLELVVNKANDLEKEANK